MSWIDKIKSKTSITKKDSTNAELWAECSDCKSNIFIADLEKNSRVCPQCDHHFRVSAKQRINQLL
jgi:acetyl-CoA carboxylase carboxyl transferase subunit beta